MGISASERGEMGFSASERGKMRFSVSERGKMGFSVSERGETPGHGGGLHIESLKLVRAQTLCERAIVF